MILITGATGLLGNNVVRRALQGGLDAAALVRPESSQRPFEGLAMPRIAVDLARDDLGKMLGQGDIVVHCAARVAIGSRDLDGFRADNVVPTARLAAACREAGARLVHVSTVDTLVWGTAELPGDETPGAAEPVPTAYSISKREAEAALLAEVDRGLDAVIVHPAYMLGPWDWKPSSGRMMLEVAKTPLAVAPPGGNDFCHVEDVADGVIAAALRPSAGGRYILGGEALTYAAAFRLMREIAGRGLAVATAPAWLVRALGRCGDALAALTGREPALNGASAAIACLPHHFSSARAIRDLGYRPRPARAAMTDAWAWFRAHGYA